MTATPAPLAADLLRAMADTLCRHGWYQLSDALHEVMADEPDDRWTNLVAALSWDLDLPPGNAYDHDQLAADEEPDRPAAYEHRLDTWSADVDNALDVADRLRLLADRVEAALTDTSQTGATA